MPETEIPLTLQPGEHGDIFIPWDNQLASELGYPRSVKAVIHTPLGSKKVRVGSALREYFRDKRRNEPQR